MKAEKAHIPVLVLTFCLLCKVVLATLYYHHISCGREVEMRVISPRSLPPRASVPFCARDLDPVSPLITARRDPRVASIPLGPHPTALA